MLMQCNYYTFETSIPKHDDLPSLRFYHWGMGYPKLWRTSHVLSMLSQCRRQFCAQKAGVSILSGTNSCPSCSSPPPLWVSLQALPAGSGIEDVCHGMSAKVDSELKKAFDMQKCHEFTGKHVDRAQQQ